MISCFGFERMLRMSSKSWSRWKSSTILVKEGRSRPLYAQEMTLGGLPLLEVAINVDALVGNGYSAMAIIGRNHAGTLIFCATQCAEELSLQLAELKALVWASGLAINLGWLSVK